VASCAKNSRSVAVSSEPRTRRSRLWMRVGRLLLPLAERCMESPCGCLSFNVGEARRNCDAVGATVFNWSKVTTISPRSGVLSISSHLYRPAAHPVERVSNSFASSPQSWHRRRRNVSRAYTPGRTRLASKLLYWLRMKVQAADGMNLARGRAVSAPVMQMNAYR